MKNLLVLLLVVFASNAMAKPLPPEDLKLVNEYIAELIAKEAAEDGEEPNGSVTIDEARLADDEDALLTMVSAGFDFLADEDDNAQVEGTASLDLEGEDINLNVLVTVSQNMSEMIEFGMQYLPAALEEINKQGFYQAMMNLEDDGNVKILTVSLAPANYKAVSIDFVKLEVRVEKSGLTQFHFEGTFNAKADLVANGRRGLTNILTSLKNQEEPKEEDKQALEDIIDAIGESLSMEEAEEDYDDDEDYE
jgi:hypothetical protein